MNNARISAVLAAVSLSACTVAPSVKYSTIASNADVTGKEASFFYLRSSRVDIDATKDSKGTLTGFTLQTQPVESLSKRLAITRDDPFYARTTLNITKLPNTDLWNEVGSEVADYRIKIINTVAAIAIKVVAFGASSGTVKDLDPAQLPQSIKLDNVVRDAPKGEKTISLGNGVQLILGALPTDARPIGQLPEGRVNYAIYAACRPATIFFKYNNSVYQKNFKVSDPQFYQFAVLPKNGKVVFHSECGASTTNEKDSVSTNSEVVDALATQAKAIKDAIDAAKQDGKK
ncbi:hypothetical protein HU751_020675 [Pseudomonas sp. BW13M1]|uniref:Lipoprotein n=1 Tax=Pseudomonas peradeniyensis TaxID=2745488 RepID=A0A923G6V1_9PSED|nr:hypothetical protein [Pseudomonas peradeniyensis]MBV4507248.1 hypothetical protein [Pseudomonas peradeniyensis]